MYASVDPIFMIMLIFNLGSEYVVWDKSATITFLKPGRGTLDAKFVLTEKALAEIRGALEQQASVDRKFEIDLKDASGNVCARVTKTIYIRRKKVDTDNSA